MLPALGCAGALLVSLFLPALPSARRGSRRRGRPHQRMGEHDVRDARGMGLGLAAVLVRRRPASWSPRFDRTPVPCNFAPSPGEFFRFPWAALIAVN